MSRLSPRLTQQGLPVQEPVPVLEQGRRQVQVLLSGLAARLEPGPAVPGCLILGYVIFVTVYLEIILFHFGIV